MSLYNKFYEAYKKCYLGELTNTKIQTNVNEIWNSLKNDKQTLTENVEKKVTELLQEKTRKDARRLTFFTRQVCHFFQFGNCNVLQ